MFWRVYDVLSQDREPAPSLWDALFATPGYAALEKREHKRKVLTEAFRLAYLPSNKDKIAAALVGDDFTSYILPHLLDVAAQRESLRTYETRLGSMEWLHQSLDRTQTLLPEGMINQHAPPPISFVIFAPDGRGYSDIIVVDILHLMKGFDPEGFFAHEFFHYYRRFFETKYSPTKDEEPLLNILANAQEEGTADQLDKSSFPFLTEKELRALVPDPQERAFIDSYREYYAASSYWMGRVEAVLQDYAEGLKDASDNARLLRKEIPIDGRPLGAFMAHTILNIAGRPKLISVAGDPLGFWLLYNDTARRSAGKAPILSEQAIGVISKMKSTSK